MKFEECMKKILINNKFKTLDKNQEQQNFFSYIKEKDLEKELKEDSISVSTGIHDILEDLAKQDNSASIAFKTEYGTGIISVTSEYTKLNIQLVDCKELEMVAPTFDYELLNPLIQYFSLFVQTINPDIINHLDNYINENSLVQPIF